MEELLSFFRERPEMLVTILSGFLLPIGLVWLNNYYNLRGKSREQELDLEYSSKKEIQRSEKEIYASLSKILFDVQQLHVALSGTCVDSNCITDAVKKFDTDVNKCHEEISKNLLHMPSSVINEIYRFYSKISDLKISLREFNDTKNFSMAHVCVYDYATEIAETLIDIQEKLLEGKNELKKKFNKTEQQIMKYCCGSKPPKELLEQYLTLLRELKPTVSDVEIERIRNRWGKYKSS